MAQELWMQFGRDPRASNAHLSPELYTEFEASGFGGGGSGFICNRPPPSRQNKLTAKVQILKPLRMATMNVDNTKENVPVKEQGMKRKFAEVESERVEVPLRVKRLSKHATIPKRGSAGAAGYDIASSEDCSIPARGKALVKTDLSLAIPPGTYGRVAPRSGLALKHSIDTGAGVIDADYRGPLGVILFNFSAEDFQVKRGDRIAQLILEKICTPDVEEVDDLEETTRGAGGFGSTGVASNPDDDKETRPLKESKKA